MKIQFDDGVLWVLNRLPRELYEGAWRELNRAVEEVLAPYGYDDEVRAAFTGYALRFERDDDMQPVGMNEVQRVQFMSLRQVHDYIEGNVRAVECPECHGTGETCDGYGMVLCTNCAGAGQIKPLREHLNDED